MAQPVTQVVREATAQVLVAKKAISVGERLTPDLVEWQDWPQGAVRSEYVTETSAPKAVADLTGALARYDFVPGEPILRQKLALPGEGYLSAVLDPGKRGVSVSVTADSASGGFVLPEDHVDVVETRNDTKASDTILRNVRVLAIDKRLGQAATPVAPGTPGAGAAPADPNDPNSTSFSNQAIATLELNPGEAEIVISAAANGKLSLVLVPLADFGTADTGGQRTTDQAIRMTSPFWTTGTTTVLQTVH
jgi:pilus assembly protein CpaB